MNQDNEIIQLWNDLGRLINVVEQQQEMIKKLSSMVGIQTMNTNNLEDRIKRLEAKHETN